MKREKKLKALKNCVFCGKSARLLKNDLPENQTWDIDCMGCDFTLHGFDSPEEAIEEWNHLEETADKREFGTPHVKRQSSRIRKGQNR